MDKEEERALTDLALRAARGDGAAFDALWRDERWIARVEGICRLIYYRSPLPGVDSRDGSAELIQKTCMRMVEKHALFSAKNGASIFTWCFHVARNIHRKERSKIEKGAARLKKYPLRLKNNLSDENPEAALRVKEAWRGLNPRRQKIFVLKLRCDSVAQVAEKLYEAEWPSMTEHERKRVTDQVYRELKKVQQILYEAAEDKGLGDPGRNGEDSGGPRE